MKGNSIKQSLQLDLFYIFGNLLQIIWWSIRKCTVFKTSTKYFSITCFLVVITYSWPSISRCFNSLPILYIVNNRFSQHIGQKQWMYWELGTSYFYLPYSAAYMTCCYKVRIETILLNIRTPFAIFIRLIKIYV